MVQIEIINGPNLNLLGTREPAVYGDQTFEDFLVGLRARYTGVEIGYNQSNVEGEIVNMIQAAGQSESCTGIVLNAAAYSHTSIAIADAIKSISKPVVLVHISNIYLIYFRSFVHDTIKCNCKLFIQWNYRFVNSRNSIINRKI